MGGAVPGGEGGALAVVWAWLSVGVELPGICVYSREEETPSLPPSGSVTLGPRSNFRHHPKLAAFSLSAPIPAEAIVWERALHLFYRPGS